MIQDIGKLGGVVSCGRLVTISERSPDQIEQQTATYEHSGFLIGEQPGSVDGSVFVFWTGEPGAVSLSPALWSAIEEFIGDHDVVAVYVVPGGPVSLHRSLTVRPQGQRPGQRPNM